MFANMFPRADVPVVKISHITLNILEQTQGKSGWSRAPSAGSAATATGSVWAFSWRPGKYHGRWWIPWFWGITWDNSFFGVCHMHDPFLQSHPGPFPIRFPKGEKEHFSSLKTIIESSELCVHLDDSLHVANGWRERHPKQPASVETCECLDHAQFESRKKILESS